MEKGLFLEYNKCGTCRKAKKWLDEHKVDYTLRPIIDDAPTVAELEAWISRSGLPEKRFFNTSGLVYKAMGLKDKIGELSHEALVELLASDGKLVKRPLWVDDKRVLVGFKEAEWEQLLGE